MAENLNLKTIDTVDTRPFKKLVMTIGELPTSFVESMTYYELLAWFVNYLETVIIPTVNNNAEAVKELQDLFVKLKKFVDEYFDNLDLQEEVNKKIDEMVESGQLQTIIAQYANLTKVYDTQADLANDTFITSGFAKTLGLVTKGDGFGAYYEIGETGDIQLASGAYATMIPNFGGGNYYNFTTETIRRYNTTCYITTIPLNDENGEQINPYISKTNGTGPLKYAQDNHTSFTINASLGTHTLISNGEIIQNYDSTNPELPDAAYYLGLNDNRELIDFQAKTATSAQMLAGGAKQAWLAYYRILTAGVKEDFNAIDASWAEWPASGSHIATNRNPRQCIGQKTDKTIIILTTEGRRSGEYGLNSEECANIMLEYGVYNAWNLDGGGSTSTVVKGYKINSNIDGDFTEDRVINAVLNIKNNITNEELAKVNSEIGNVTQLNNNKLMSLLNQTIVSGSANQSLNDLADQQSLKYVVGATDAPYQSGYLLTVPNSDPRYFGSYAGQLFIDRNNGRTYTRVLNNNNFLDWRPTEGYIAHAFSNNSDQYTITSDDTYEKVTLTGNSIYSNVQSYKPNLLTINENSEYIFNTPDNNVLLEITFELILTNTEGVRYIKLMSGDDNIANSTARFSGPLGGASTHTITALVRTTQPITLQMYGKTGDKIYRIKFIAKSFN